jgi:type IV pilus assembly protein PilC
MVTEIPEVPVRFWHRISLKDKALFYEHLANLLDGGVTFLESLSSFCEKTENPRFYRDAMELLMLVESGDSVSTAMKKLPRTFDRGEVSIVEAGEQSGTLQRSFTSLADELRDREVLLSKLKGAMTYPAIILAFLVAAITVIMVFVVPKLLPLFENAGTELPAVTVSLIATSDFIANHFFLLLFFVVGVIIGFVTYVNSYQGRRQFDQVALSIPLIGKVYRNYLIVRVATTLGLLL